MVSPHQLIGKPVARVDALEKVTGAAIFGDDLSFPGLLHGKVLRSPYAHAHILRVDASKARALPGVKAVVTGQDFVARGGEALRDQPFLAIGKVRHVGEAVAAVAAVDEATAEEACRLIEVEYEELPVLVDVERAIEPEAPLIHEEVEGYAHLPVIRPQPGTNVCHRITFVKGDVEEGWRRSDVVYEHTFTTPMIQHSAIEPHVAVAQVDGAGRITVRVPNDSPHRLRKDLADAMEVPPERIRVIVPPYMGGGFGGKGGIKIESVAIALAHFAHGRPVRINLTREEVFTSSLTRHPSVVRLRTGVKRDGTLVARQATVIYDTGAYAEKGPTVCQQACVAAVGPYRIPHVLVEGYTVYTNKPVAGAMRGYGIPQVAWAHESQMDIIARDLGLDPAEFRLRNAVEEGDEVPTGQQKLFSVGLKECIRRVAEELEWGKSRPANQGVGIACAFKNTKTPTGSTAFVRLNADGSATILTSTVEIGQGANTAFSQIVAEELGVSLERVRLVTPDTDVTPFDASTTSSRSTFHMGNAVRMAADDVKRQVLEMGAPLLEASPEELEYRDGRIYRRGADGRGLTPQEVITAVYGAGMDVLGRGSFYALSEEGKGVGMWAGPSVFWMYAAHGAEVEVDPETGKVRVLKAVGAHDVGKAINPMMVAQQIEDGIAKGIGYALLEEMLIDERGQVLNPNWHNYIIPTAFDVPDIRSIIVEAAHEQGPYGAKGVGEMTMVPTAAAVGNAILDATGVAIHDLPLSQERLWRALRGARGAKG